MTDEAVSPLRRRMIEDMTIRKFAPKTQHDYVQRIKNFAAFLGRSPDTATFEDVRRYQLHLASSGVGVPTINQTVSTLRFFFRVTLKRHEILEHTPVVHEPRTKRTHARQQSTYGAFRPKRRGLHAARNSSSEKAGELSLASDLSAWPAFCTPQ